MNYPEHEKLDKVRAQSQSCGEFIEWLSAEKGIHLARVHAHTPECHRDHVCGHDCACAYTVVCGRQPGGPREKKEVVCGLPAGHLFTIHERVTTLLAEFFEIDEAKIEDEKRAMLDELRQSGTP